MGFFERLISVSEGPVGSRSTHDWVAFLQELMDDDKTLERLHFVCQDRLSPQAVPHGQGRMIVPGVNDALWRERSNLRYASSDTLTSHMLLL